jgi:tetratricopeptide (TPR) repeat protein
MHKRVEAHSKWIFVLFSGVMFLLLFAWAGWYMFIQLPQAEAVGEKAIDSDGFAGSESCRDCHGNFYTLWSTSHHGLAMQPFTPELAKAQLTINAEPLTIEQMQYQAYLTDEGGYIAEIGPDGLKKYPIEHVVGGKYVYYFLTPMERGRLQVLPLAYDVQRKEWYDTAASMVRHAGGIADEALNWKDSLFTFNRSCYRCHVSQLDKQYDLSSDSYRTTWTEPGINCETCHGPAQAHNRAFREALPGSPPKDMKLVTVMQNRGFTAHQVDSSCAPCHAKMTPLTTAFRPGEDYFDHYDLVTLEDPDFYPDARDLGENFTYTLWRMNPCSLSGQMDCLHCQTSSARNRYPQSGDQANASCLPCHEQRVRNASEHTQHKPNSPGNRCIACHMPMTEFARMHRSDHSNRPPMPAATQSFGSPNACNLCHTDQDAAWADARVRLWRRRDYQKDVLEVGHLIKAARENDWSRLDQMIHWIASNPSQEIFINSLVRLMRNCPDVRKWPLLAALVQDNPSPLVRSSAAESLGDYLTDETIAVLLKAAEDPYRLVRIRAAFALAAVPDNYIDSDQQTSLRKAQDEFLASAEALPDHWMSHFNLGVFHMAQRQYNASAEAFAIAHRLRPDVLPPLVNMAMAWNMAGNNERAESNLRKATALYPDDEAVHLNLALLLAEEQRLAEAEAAFRQVLRINEKSAPAAYNLSVILSGRNLSEAVDWAEKAYRNAPDQPRYGYAYAVYLNQAGCPEKAATILEELVGQDTGYAVVYHLLGHIYRTQGRNEEAASLFEKGYRHPAFSPEEKAAFVRKLQSLTSERR